MPLAAAEVAGVSVSAEVGGLTQKGREEWYTVDGEVVIAYRVLAIRKRVWRKNELNLDEDRGRDEERMLGDDDDKK